MRHDVSNFLKQITGQHGEHGVRVIQWWQKYLWCFKLSLGLLDCFGEAETPVYSRRRFKLWRQAGRISWRFAGTGSRLRC